MTGTDPVAVLRAVCADGARRARGAELRDELTAIGRQLDRPLQLAVAGAVGVGKSTLINAVLRRAVAPVDAGECTRVVTWYEFGPHERVLVERADGIVAAVPLVAGRVPAALGVPAERVVRLRVQLPDPWLRAVTVIDTPGMDTVSADNEQATRRLLFGDAAAEHAQALLYVLRHVQRFDADVLADFRALSTACGLTAVTTAAVLTQVDRRGDEDDPWPTARRLARRATADLGGLVLDVVPVVGLLAETARARLLGPAEVAALRGLAAIDPAELDDLLLDLGDFTDEDADGPVAPPLRRTLVARLHRYGLREAVAHLRRRPDCSADELHHWLAGRSGFGSDDAVVNPSATFQVTPDDPELVRTLAEVLDRLTRHAGRLKAFAAAGRLARLTGGAPDRILLEGIRATVDESRPVAGSLRSLRVLAACAAVGRGQLRLDEAMTAELMTLARADEPAAQLGLPPTATPAEIGAAAVAASRRWREVAQLAGPSVGGQRARDVLAALEDIAADALERSVAPAGRRPVSPAGPRSAAPVGPQSAPPAPAPATGPRSAPPAEARSAPPDSRSAPPVWRSVPPGSRLARPAGSRPAPAPPRPDVTPSTPPAAPRPPREAADTALDRASLERLLRSPLLAGPERAAVAALRDARGLRSAVGAPPNASGAEVTAAAALLAGRFRALLHQPLPPPERRTVQAVCDTMEAIARGASIADGERR